MTPLALARATAAATRFPLCFGKLSTVAVLPETTTKSERSVSARPASTRR